MIYITGDTHSDVSRFSTTEFPEQMLMSKNDYVIVCGDFGLVWNGSKRENYWLDWLENKPFTTLFVSGNHENFDMLKTYPVEEWHGGKVQFIRPSIIHLMRGQVFEDVGGNGYLLWVARLPMTSKMVFLTQMTQNSMKKESTSTEYMPCTVFLVFLGGLKRCPRRKNTQRPKRTSTLVAGPLT